MPLTNPNKVVTEERLNEYHRTILPYLGGNSMVACGGYAPIGTVIAYMGTRAPSDFLICDGTVYNIADYTELADFFELQFGSANFFGGDGATTFAVPDLRGEFLRGTGTNSHANQGSGANVGVHQDGTEIPNITTWGDYILINNDGSETERSNRIKNSDSAINKSNSIEMGVKGSGTTNTLSRQTTRPTNTSVLYCIKAKSQGNGYSLDEQIVDTWIDGKPIYQKTFDFGALPNNTTKNVTHNISNMADIIYIGGYATTPNHNYYPLPKANVESINNQIDVEADRTNITIKTKTDYSDCIGYVTIKYTKSTD